MTIDDDLAAWITGLDDLFALVAGRFFRVEPRPRARAYVRGLLAPLASKNGWTLAELSDLINVQTLPRLPRHCGCTLNSNHRRDTLTQMIERCG